MTKLAEQLNVDELINSNAIAHDLVNNIVTIKYDEIRIRDKGNGTIEQEFLYQGKKLCYREKKGEFQGITIEY